jgi:atypical dual specificity phosphatase
MSHELITDYNQIDDHIFIGTNQCCILHFKDEFLKMGITSDISLEAERIDAAEGVDSYLWLPVADHYAPTQNQLSQGVGFMTELIKQGQKMYVHCMNGHGRAPTLVAAYYISTGLTVEAAIEKIKQKRTEIHPNEVQIAALSEFKTRIS